MVTHSSDIRSDEPRENSSRSRVFGWLVAVALAALIFLPSSGRAFSFFTAFSPSVSQIGANSYRFRVQVDYNFDMIYADNGMPAMSAFTGFSLGRLIGINQRNFTPWGDDPGQEVRYSSGWWRTGHLGFYPLSLPGHEFGYDFDYAGSLPRTMSLHYVSEATWSWFDFEQGMQYQQEMYRGRLHIDMPANAAAPSGIPEPTTALLWAAGLSAAYWSRRRPSSHR